jgi:hypothetical protein
VATVSLWSITNRASDRKLVEASIDGAAKAAAIDPSRWAPRRSAGGLLPSFAAHR